MDWERTLLLAGKGEVEEFAGKIGLKIPGDIHKLYWGLPILKELFARIEELEKKVGFREEK